MRLFGITDEIATCDLKGDMGKLENKVAVITGDTSGMALAHGAPPGRVGSRRGGDWQQRHGGAGRCLEPRRS